MADCPFCQFQLTDVMVADGQCPSCERALADASDTFAMPSEFDSIWGNSDEFGSHLFPDGQPLPPLAANPIVKSHTVTDTFAPGDVAPDYELLDVLAKGGMGVVYKARQTAVDRTIALKMIKAEKARSKSARAKFLAEAVVTGDLEHPNIVPLYDVGTNDAGLLFYAMKQVQGVAWSKNLKLNTLSENLDILMRVSDAIAFAHSRNIIHRDIKPENVMLGDFGEVLVMDWGLAVAVGPDGKAHQLAGNSIAGTPAYMAPEMAKGDRSCMGFASDVYLLGAVLYQLITGAPPHRGDSVREMLKSAVANDIVPPPDNEKLAAVALRALATDVGERYPSVKSFQNAIREYRLHADSIELSSQATQTLANARALQDYDEFAQAVFGYRQALAHWRDNQAAADGECQARLEYARCALAKDDLDLAASLLLPDEPEHTRLIRRVETAQHLRRTQRKRQRIIVYTARALVVVILLTMTMAFLLVRAEKQLALTEKEKALLASKAEIEQRQRAESAMRAAEQARQAEARLRQEAEAEKERALAAQQAALREKEKAVAAKRVAVEQRRRAEEQRKIAAEAHAKALAAERAKEIQRRHTESARQEAKRAQASLSEEKDKTKHAEAKFTRALQRNAEVKYIATLLNVQNKMKELAFPEARKLLMTCPPELRNWEWGRLHRLTTLNAQSFHQEAAITTLALTRDSSQVVTGNVQGQVIIWHTASGKVAKTLGGHSHPILAVAFTHADSRVWSIDQSGVALLHELGTGEELMRTREAGADLAAVTIAEAAGKVLLAFADGKALVKDLNTGLRIRKLVGHQAPIQAAAFVPESELIVTGDAAGAVKLWQPTADMKAVELTVNGTSLSPIWGRSGSATFVDLNADNTANQDTAVADVLNLDTVPAGRSQDFIGHSQSISAIAISPDGQRILTGSHDKTVRLWSRDGKTLMTLAGHKMAVNAIAFFPNGERILTGCVDGAMHVWDVRLGREVMALPASETAIEAVGLMNDGRMITGCKDGRTTVWETADKRRPTVLEGHRGAVRTAAFSPDGLRVATGGDDGHVIIWNSQSGKPIRQVTGHRGAVYAIAFHGNQRLITAGIDRRVILWDTTTDGKALQILEHRGQQQAYVTVAANGNSLATAAAGQGLKLEVNPAKPTVSWHGLLSPTANHRLAPSADGWPILTDASGQSQLTAYQGHNGAVTSACFSPDGTRLLTGGADKLTKLWSTESGLDLMTIKGHSAAIRHASFSPSGRQIVTCSDDGTAILWSADRWERNGK